MTQTLVLFFRIGILLLMGYTLFAYIRASLKRKHWIPAGGSEWKDFLSDATTLGGGVFVLFLLQKNYQEPMNLVLQNKGKNMPALDFRESLTGRPLSLASYRGKVVILNIWATWCGPCRREMPDLDKLQRDYREKGLEIIALSDEDEETVNRFVENNPYSFTTGTILSGHPVISRVNTRPVSILIDRQGNIRNMVAGSRGYGFFESWVKNEL